MTHLTSTCSGRIGSRLALLFLIPFLLTACHQEPADIVISEIMPANKTGLLASDGEPRDWIEILNNSAAPAPLKGYILAKDSADAFWTFPDTTLQPQARLIVFATKKKLKGCLCCGFKLRREHGAVSLLSPQREEICRVDYDDMNPDQALALGDKGKYKKTYQPSPLHPNDDAGYAAAAALLDSQRTDPLRIWEYLSKDETPWVEIKNVSPAPVTLDSYTLATNDTLTLPLPADKTLAPGDFLLVKDTRKVLDDEIAILRHGTQFADGVCAHPTYAGVSIGRTAAKPGFFFFGQPTPAAENTTAAYAEIAKAPEFTTAPGPYKEPTLNVTLKGKGDIHYTLDGSRPTAASPLYSKPIALTATAIVRAVCIKKDKLISPVATATYILGVSHTIPVVSVTLNPDDLFSNATGIYAEGPNAEAEEPHLGANYWQDWEKNAHVELFDGDKGFSYDCGIRIFGSYSRSRPKKSFTIRFRERYGKKNIHYDLFADGHKEKYKSFVLRSGSQDDIGVMARDEFFTALMARQSPSLHVQRYRPVALYLNGEYWGLYYIREKVNDQFVARHLGVKSSSVSLIEGVSLVKSGSIDDYTQVKNYAATHDLRDDKAYDYVASKINIQSLIDYKIAEYYSGNQDVANIRFFRTTDTGADTRWHWIYYDLDWGFYYTTPLHYYISASATRESGLPIEPFNVIIDRILQNPRGRELFLQRWAHHRSVTFSQENALTLFDGIIAAIRPEMERNCKRWPQMSYTSWEKNVAQFREKIKSRPDELHPDVIRELNVTPEEQKKYFK